MPLKVVVELQIHAVTCPGVYLTESSDVYLSVCILGQCKETDCVPPMFPLLFHEKMWFEKVFEKATDPVAVVELLERTVTKFKLSELITSEGEDLAFYEENTRDFLFPEPKLTPTCPGVDRELLMKTYPSFPGIAPKLEFATRTTITELPLQPRRWYHDKTKSRSRRSNSASPRQRCISPTRHKMAKKNKLNKRLARSSGSRSPSPSPTQLHHDVCRESHQQLSPRNLKSVKFKAETDPRPPFVVRHVDTSKMFGEQTPLQVTNRSGRQNGGLARNSQKSQLKRALSFDSWKASCPAAKVIREPADHSSSDHGSPSFEKMEPVNYSYSFPDFCHGASLPSPPHYRSQSPAGRWASPPNRLYSSPNCTWEEINERVRNLLTSHEAKQRLSMGVTDSEMDDVLERRSVSLRCSPLSDSREQRYSS